MFITLRNMHRSSEWPSYKKLTLCPGQEFIGEQAPSHLPTEHCHPTWLLVYDWLQSDLVATTYNPQFSSNRDQNQRILFPKNIEIPLYFMFSGNVLAGMCHSSQSISDHKLNNCQYKVYTVWYFCRHNYPLPCELIHFTLIPLSLYMCSLSHCLWWNPKCHEAIFN